MSAVQTMKAGGMVRNREDHTISGSVDCEGRRISYSLPPNQWVKVEREVFDMLKRKFSVQEDRWVPDAEMNERNPHPKGTAPQMRAEPKPTYILEFKD